MLQAIKRSARLYRLIERCNTLVGDTLSSSRFHEAQIALESFSSGGKRLRPALVLLTSTIPDRAPLERLDESLVDLAGAIELIHLATLFHDDVIDEVEVRRGRPSAKAKYGNHASVLAGDFALSEALLLIQRSSLYHTMPEFLRTIKVLVRGESRETRHKYDFDMNDATYFEIISEKSASLFALSCKVGALAKRSELADTLGHFGWNLGMAFQMIDDLDDMLDLPNDSPDCDLKNGYLALPLIQALSNLADGHREGLVRIIREGDFTLADQKHIVSLLDELGTIENTRNEIHEHLDHASTILGKFGEMEATYMLGLILEELRKYADGQLGNFRTFLAGGN